MNSSTFIILLIIVVVSHLSDIEVLQGIAKNIRNGNLYPNCTATFDNKTETFSFEHCGYCHMENNGYHITKMFYL